MKILFVTPRYYPAIGGVEYVVQSIAEELSKQRHEVVIYTLDHTNGKLPKKDVINNVLVRRYLGLSPQEAYHIPSPKIMLDIIASEADIIHIHSVHAMLTTLTLGIINKHQRRVNKVILSPHYIGESKSPLRQILFKILSLIHI